MELNEYQRLANQTDQQPETGNFETDPRSILVPLLGMAGEVGELLGSTRSGSGTASRTNCFPNESRKSWATSSGICPMLRPNTA